MAPASATRKRKAPEAAHQQDVAAAAAAAAAAAPPQNLMSPSKTIKLSKQQKLEIRERARRTMEEEMKSKPKPSTAAAIAAAYNSNNTMSTGLSNAAENKPSNDDTFLSPTKRRRVSQAHSRPIQPSQAPTETTEAPAVKTSSSSSSSRTLKKREQLAIARQKAAQWAEKAFPKKTPSRRLSAPTPIRRTAPSISVATSTTLASSNDPLPARITPSQAVVAGGTEAPTVARAVPSVHNSSPPPPVANPFSRLSYPLAYSPPIPESPDSDASSASSSSFASPQSRSEMPTNHTAVTANSSAPNNNKIANATSPPVTSNTMQTYGSFISTVQPPHQFAPSSLSSSSGQSHPAVSVNSVRAANPIALANNNHANAASAPTSLTFVAHSDNFNKQSPFESFHQSASPATFNTTDNAASPPASINYVAHSDNFNNLNPFESFHPSASPAPFNRVDNPILSVPSNSNNNVSTINNNNNNNTTSPPLMSHSTRADIFNRTGSSVSQTPLPPIGTFQGATLTATSEDHTASVLSSQKLTPVISRMEADLAGYTATSDINSLANDLNLVEHKVRKQDSAPSENWANSPETAPIHETTLLSKKAPRWRLLFSSNLVAIVVAVTAIGIFYYGTNNTEPFLAWLGNVNWTSSAQATLSAPPCFIDNIQDDTLFERPSDPVVCRQPAVPCPSDGVCQFSRLQACLHRHRQVATTEDACILTNEANQTLLEAQNVLVDWTLQQVCTSAGCPYAASISEESTKFRPWFAFSQLMGELDIEWDLELFSQAPESFSTRKEGDLLLIGLSQEFIQHSLTVPWWCLTMIWTASAFYMCIGGLISGVQLFMTGSASLLMAYPVRSLSVLAVIAAVVKIHQMRSERGQLRAKVAIVRRLAYGHLKGAAPAKVPVLHVRDDIAWELHPQSEDERRYLKTKVWPRVVHDLEHDNRVGKESIVVDRKFQRTWQWLAVTPKK